YLFLIGTPMMAVAAIVTFAPAPLYEWYALAPRLWGFPALDDQRLGGLIMWIPGGLFWWGVMSVVFLRWSSRESRSDGPRSQGAPPCPPRRRLPRRAASMAWSRPRRGSPTWTASRGSSSSAATRSTSWRGR